VQVNRDSGQHRRKRRHDRAWVKAAARELNRPWWEQTYVFGLFIACGSFITGAGLMAVAALGETGSLVFAVVAVTCLLVGYAALRLWWRTFSARVDSNLRLKNEDQT
jgi:hypothetical protein